MNSPIIINQNDGIDMILWTVQVFSETRSSALSIIVFAVPSGSCPTSSGLCLINSKIGNDSGIDNKPITLYAVLHE